MCSIISKETWLVLDPGRAKCGLALVEADLAAGEVKPLRQEVVVRSEIVARVLTLRSHYPVRKVLLGHRTGATALAKELQPHLQDLPLCRVNEDNSTLEAKKRYLAAHPPRGWRKLIPSFWREPEEPYDDYVAVILAERYLAGLAGSRHGRAGGGSGAETRGSLPFSFRGAWRKLFKRRS